MVFKTNKTQTYLNNRADLLDEILPLLEYLDSYIDTGIFCPYGFTYTDVKLGKYYYWITFVCSDNTSVITDVRRTTCKERHQRQQPEITEIFSLNYILKYSYRVLTLPLVEKNNVIQLGKYTFYEYMYEILPPNYCNYCRMFPNKFHSHWNSKAHKNKVKNIVLDALKHTKLNTDCLNSILEYL